MALSNFKFGIWIVISENKDKDRIIGIWQAIIKSLVAFCLANSGANFLNFA